MSTILTSLHGKQAGLDKDGFLTSPIGLKVPALYVGASDTEVRVADTGVTQATISSTSIAIGNSGLTTITSTASKAYVLTDPTGAGLRKAISQTSSSTAAKTVTSAGGAGIGFDGLNHIATFLGRGDALYLQSISTAMWAVIGRSGAVTLTTA
jgi:hypothetical protein